MELNDTNEQLQAIINTLHEPLLILTADLKVKFANPSFYNNFKVSPEKTVGKPVHELGNNQWDIPALRILLNNVLPTNNIFNDFEVTHHFETIGKRVMLVNARRLDSVQLILLGIRDITDRKAEEEKIKEAKIFAESIIDTLHEPLLVLTPDLRVKSANPAFYNDFEVSPEDTEGKLVYELGNNQWNIPALRTLLDDVLPTNNTFNDFEVTHHFEAIGRKVMLVNARRLDSVQLILLGIRDITERKAVEEAFRQSEEHLRLIMDSATDYAVFTMDTERNVTQWNAGAEKILGYSKEEIIGKKGDLIFIEEDREKQPEGEMNAAIETGRAENERWHVRKDGSFFWGSGSMRPLRGKDNELLGFVKIMIDNTERKLMEEALKEAKKTAEQAAKAKENFLAHMSHEIRTPLNAIVGVTNLLLQQNPHPSQLENLHTLKFSTENLRLLVNDILDFSKIQASKMELEESDINLRGLFSSLQKAHELRAREQGNDLHFQIDDKIPHLVKVDQLKLSQVLHNLTSNALKFTKNGKITVEARLKQKKGDRLWVKFSVIDTGIGINDKLLPKIFDAFTQADNSTVRSYEGTGLGLSITKSLLELMGSGIDVKIKVGSGSTFSFVLPMKKGSKETVSKKNGDVLSGFEAPPFSENTFGGRYGNQPDNYPAVFERLVAARAG